ncbi:MAG TPA: hypothetical protein VOB72_23620 [Candidatus Dormibacteraeota bacterium]|nr:hypothetical protein [Candidatus Dormibacteraeota bacterium]
MLRERGRPISPFRLLLVAAAAALVAAACGGAGANRPSPSPSNPSATPTATPAPSFQVLVTQAKSASPGIAMYDAASGGFRTIPTAAAAAQARFVTAGRISYQTPDGIVSQDLDGSQRRTEVAGDIVDHAWSRDGALAYIAGGGVNDDQFTLTIKRPDGQTTSARIGVSTGIGGVIPQRTMRFSPDGQLLLIAEPMVADPYLQIRAPDGSLRFAPPTGNFVGGGGAAWIAGGKVVLSNAGSLQTADPATRDGRTLLAGVHAWNPAASPDGRYIAYEQRDPQPDQFGGYGPPRLQAFDGTAGKVVDGFRRDGAILPWFVSPTEVWFSAGSDPNPAIERYDLSGHAERPAGVSGLITDIRIA